MPIYLEPKMSNEEVRILIIGVGGGGGNAINRMIEDEVQGVEYIVANTDYQALQNSLSENKIQLGEKLTKGLGAGAKPEIGKKAAEESYDKIKEELTGTNMVFIAAGMGGGTGTGAAPIVAKISKELGALTVGIVTMPFNFEGSKKKVMAEEGLQELRKNVDSIIILPNDKIFEVSPKGTTMDEAFKRGNEVLKKGVKGITDIIKVNGIINPDFADVRTVMEDKGICHMGFGRAKGENRAIEAAKMAITSPLLDTSVKNASHLLVSITATKESMKIEEFNAIGEFIREAVGEDEGHLADNIIVGNSYLDEMGEELSVSIIATGIDRKIETVVDMDKPNKAKVEKNFNINASTQGLDIDDEEMDEAPAITEIKEVEKKATKELVIPDFLKNISNKRK